LENKEKENVQRHEDCFGFDWDGMGWWCGGFFFSGMYSKLELMYGQTSVEDHALPS
jgi:hypothetical protein